MKSKLLAFLLLLVMISSLLPQAALAAKTPPTTISAPENFAAANYGGSALNCTLSAPDDLRALISQTEAERGFSMKIQGQVDFKTDSGPWHYTTDWDNAASFGKYAMDYYNALFGGASGQFLGSGRLTFNSMFPSAKDVPVPAAFNSWDWFKTHSVTVRARFAITFNKNVVFSEWTPEYVISAASKMDHKKILSDNAPTILDSKIVTKGTTNVPWAVIQLAQHPDPVQKLNAASSNSMRTEIWMRKNGDTNFVRVGDVPFSNEILNVDIGAYFGKNQTSYDAASYQVKVRYYMDERAYAQSGNTTYTLLYSAYSNIISYNMPGWSASDWAAPEVQKADDAGLIPTILDGADMTRPITREEFAAVAVLLYETVTGTKATPVAVNPFTDTTNLEVLKAYELTIVTGTTPTTFKPKDLTNREQVATMLSRAIRVMVPGGDFSTAGAPVFSDAADISSWAYDHVMFMAKIGIVKGSGGKFMPNATTTAQQAAGYATTTRQEALAMSVRIFEKYGS